MSEDDYTRQRIEEALAVLDKPKHTAERKGYLRSSISFAAIIEESGATLDEVKAAAITMQREGLVHLPHDGQGLIVTELFRTKWSTRS